VTERGHPELKENCAISGRKKRKYQPTNGKGAGKGRKRCPIRNYHGEEKEGQVRRLRKSLRITGRSLRKRGSLRGGAIIDGRKDGPFTIKKNVTGRWEQSVRGGGRSCKRTSRF